uniref:ABC transporter n=1 Tax=Candidatus Kentrum sp. TUN TaxID=2126343 RepID=A0A451APA4_9GAMM|nr:MAG: ABC transporter [Candidatus Kentron sp. TUN]VFK67891.1 MAG: ABC transporter [Candidatus Kentron sp. TUN]
MVFQDYGRSLFPWFTVRKQLTYARNCIDANRTEGNAVDANVEKILELTGLSGYADMLPNQLSGGMKQRVALARALVLKPGVLLLDEPFGSLDAYNRYQLEDYLLKTLKNMDIGMILVTHDLDEAIYLCNRIIIIKRSNRYKIKRRIRIP